MLRLSKGKFPDRYPFFGHLKELSKKSDTIIWEDSKVWTGRYAIYRIVSYEKGALAALAVIGSLVAHGGNYVHGKDQYQNVHVWRFPDSCERCNGDKSVYGIQFNSPYALYYFLLIGFEMFKEDELAQELIYSILKDLGY